MGESLVDEAQVVVVGGGFAGLTAARRLSEVGVEAIVLEASDRVGGRVDRLDLGGGVWLDLGGTWCGPTQDRIIALADEVSVGRFPQYAEGRNLVELDGRVTSYSGTIPRVGLGTLIDLARMQLGAGRAAKRVSPSAPWGSKGAESLDNISLDEWLRGRRHGRKAITLLGIGGKTIWGAEPRELSALYALGYISGAGGLDSLLDTEGGAQQDRFDGGSLEVAERVALELGDRVVKNQPVSRIEDDGGAVTVVCAGGTVRAQRVVVALPPPLCSKLDFSPALPEGRLAVQDRWKMGALTKCFAVYDEPFWREAGLTGEALSDKGPATITFDVSPPDGSVGILAGFVGGDDARAYATTGESERREQLLAGFARLYGKRAKNPDRFIEQQWAAQPFSGGGPTAIAPPGAVMASRESIREPVGRIHWAGTESAEEWAGYIDGAVRSGERAAAEVAAAISAG